MRFRELHTGDWYKEPIPGDDRIYVRVVEGLYHKSCGLTIKGKGSGYFMPFNSSAKVVKIKGTIPDTCPLEKEKP